MSTKSWPSEKSFAFFTIRHRKFHLYVQLWHTNILYLRKNTHLREDATFLHFLLKESSENIIFPWKGNIRKLTKIWPFLSFWQIFVRRKLCFSCSVNTSKKVLKNQNQTFLVENYFAWKLELVSYILWMILGI